MTLTGFPPDIPYGFAEAKYLNHVRMRLHTSCAISGTGFLVHREIIERNNGWKHYLLTEDIEFTVDSVLHGEKIGYCANAKAV